MADAAVVTLRNRRHPHVMFMQVPTRHIQMRCVYRLRGKSKRVDITVCRYFGIGDELEVQVKTATTTIAWMTGHAPFCVRVAVLPEAGPHFIVISIKRCYRGVEVSVSRSD